MKTQASILFNQVELCSSRGSLQSKTQNTLELCCRLARLHSRSSAGAQT